MSLTHHLRFLEGYLRHPQVVGSVAPSSQALAQALSEPYRRARKPSTVLEVGAGTGAITKHLGAILGGSDELDVCEIEPKFADVLRKDVLTSPDFADGVASGRVRLLEAPVQDIEEADRYDFIISCLPLNVFELEDVRKVFSSLRRCLKPGGVLSYFEYMAVRRTSRVLSVGKFRNRIRSVSSYLSENIRDYQFGTRIVLKNFPPARARYLRFER